MKQAKRPRQTTLFLDMTQFTPTGHCTFPRRGPDVGRWLRRDSLHAAVRHHRRFWCPRVVGHHMGRKEVLRGGCARCRWVCESGLLKPSSFQLGGRFPIQASGTPKEGQDKTSAPLYCFHEVCEDP